MSDERAGHYRASRFLGKGGFAEVFEYVSCFIWNDVRYENNDSFGSQEDTRTGRSVAIKQIFEGDKKTGVNLGAIKEIQVLQEVRHPNIVQVHSLGVVVFPAPALLRSTAQRYCFCVSNSHLHLVLCS